jgi:hypothetical protein
MSRRPKLSIVPPALLGTLPVKVKNGVILVGSDPHWLPGQPQSTATRALIRLARIFSAQDELRGLVLNGDLFDFPAVSKHTRIMWEDRPTVAGEIRAGQERMAEIAEAAGPSVPLVATIGNHDQRLEASLAQNAAACEGVPGFALRDHIDPRWSMAWQVEVNGPGPEGVLIRHRLKGGAGAGRANVLAAGRSVVTGHTHQLNVTRVSNSLGDFWGVDTGTMSPIGSPAFAGYTEAAAASGMAGWASGVAVLTFVDGRLIWPELVHVVDEEAGIYSFRGQLHQTAEKVGRKRSRAA